MMAMVMIAMIVLVSMIRVTDELKQEASAKDVSVRAE